jgi:hypothetical protein
MDSPEVKRHFAETLTSPVFKRGAALKRKSRASTSASSNWSPKQGSPRNDPIGIPRLKTPTMLDKPDERRGANAAFALIVLALAAAVWWEAGKLPDSPFDPLGPKSFPILVSYVLATLAAVLLVRVLAGMPLQRPNRAIPGINAGPELEYALRPRLASVVFLLTGLYALALHLGLPFLLATAGYMAVSGLLMVPRRRKPIVIVLTTAVIGALALDLIFRRLLSVDLP